MCVSLIVWGLFSVLYFLGRLIQTSISMNCFYLNGKMLIPALILNNHISKTAGVGPLEGHARAEVVAQLVESLLGMHTPQSQHYINQQWCIACNPSAWEVEAEGSEVQCHLWVCREFEDCIGYRQLCFKRKKNKRREEDGKKNAVGEE